MSHLYLMLFAMLIATGAEEPREWRNGYGETLVQGRLLGTYGDYLLISREAGCWTALPLRCLSTHDRQHAQNDLVAQLYTYSVGNMKWVRLSKTDFGRPFVRGQVFGMLSIARKISLTRCRKESCESAAPWLQQQFAASVSRVENQFTQLKSAMEAETFAAYLEELSLEIAMLQSLSGYVPCEQKWDDADLLVRRLMLRSNERMPDVAELYRIAALLDCMPTVKNVSRQTLVDLHEASDVARRTAVVADEPLHEAIVEIFGTRVAQRVGSHEEYVAHLQEAAARAEHVLEQSSLKWSVGRQTFADHLVVADVTTNAQVELSRATCDSSGEITALRQRYQVFSELVTAQMYRVPEERNPYTDYLLAKAYELLSWLEYSEAYGRYSCDN